jgi:hypothetical protein
MKLSLMNELNFARFDAKPELRLGRYDALWVRRLPELRMESRNDPRDVRADLIKWTFLFVLGGTCTVLGLLVTTLP